MKISLKNIAKIKDANININGITVIAGENNTGKSTIGKVLFTIFNSFYKINETISKEKKEMLNKNLSDLFSFLSLFLEYNIKNIIEQLLNGTLKTAEELEDEIKKIRPDIELDNKTLKNILSIVSLDNDYILKTFFQKNLFNEFNGQINNLYDNSFGEVELNISGKKIITKIKNNQIIELKRENISLNTQAIYIDNPFILDEGASVIFNTHTGFLKKILNIPKEKNLVEDAIISQQLAIITEKISSIFKGNFLIGKNKFTFDGTDQELDVKNLSTGLKTFVIIKTLIENGYIENNGTLILDEPEIHLHPEWQLNFAEIIVLLQKELGLHILLTTHSPYFLRAIQVYSSKYEIADKCKYYLAENIENYSSIRDVTTNPELIFEKLAKPLQKLEDLLYE